MSDCSVPSPGVREFPAAQAPSLWSSLAALIRLNNQSGTWLLMLPTLWSLVLASNGRPSLALLLIFAAGSFLMRSAGVIMNDLADRRFDRAVERTRQRPLAAGVIRPGHAIGALIVLLSLAGALLVTLNPLTIQLAPIAVVLAGLYPFAKRVISLPQAMLGIAFGWGTIMAWAAQTGSLGLPAWMLYGATLCWAIGYDTIYALQDREDDARVGVKSSALLFGAHVWVAVAIFFTIMLALLGAAGWITRLSVAYYGILAGIAVFLMRQVMIVRRPVPPSQAFRLFKQHVWVGAAILAAIWLGALCC
jgi:4-hydroxybenzoate polyprenyltransferase